MKGQGGTGLSILQSFAISSVNVTLFAYIQVQNLALRAHLPGALATAHNVILKPSTQSQALSPAASLSKTSVCALKTSQLTDTSTDTGQPGPQIIAPGEFLCSNTDMKVYYRIYVF